MSPQSSNPVERFIQWMTNGMLSLALLWIAFGVGVAVGAYLVFEARP